MGHNRRSPLVEKASQTGTAHIFLTSSCDTAIIDKLNHQKWIPINKSPSGLKPVTESLCWNLFKEFKISSVIFF